MIANKPTELPTLWREAAHQDLLHHLNPCKAQACFMQRLSIMCSQHLATSTKILIGQTAKA
jgi:hypothetical protein